MSSDSNKALLELAERCEQAAAKHTSWLMKDVGALIYDFGSDANECRRFYRWISQGAYFEAAMTLVPEGCVWEVGGGGDSGAIVWPCGEDKPNPIMAATPALALCAAALRARAAGG